MLQFTRTVVHAPGTGNVTGAAEGRHAVTVHLSLVESSSRVAIRRPREQH